MDYIKKNLNLIIGIIVLVFIVTFVYYYITDSKKETGAVTEKFTAQETDVEFRKMMNVLNELEKIKIKDNKKFFTRDFSADGLNLISFKDLEDFSSTEIKKQATGKTNIFSDNNSYIFDSSSSENSSADNTYTTPNTITKVITTPN